MENLWTAVVVILSTLVFIDTGNCQSEYQNGGQQNWGTGWGNWAGMAGNGGPGGNTGGGNPWSQMADQYMSQWMPKNAAPKAKGTKQNEANGWNNWAGMMGNGGYTGGGNQWLQMADRYMSQWMPNNANGTNQTGGFFAGLNKKINKAKKEKKNKKDKPKTEAYVA